MGTERGRELSNREICIELLWKRLNSTLEEKENLLGKSEVTGRSLQLKYSPYLHLYQLMFLTILT